MFVITYDEHGGFFDHRPPLPVKDTAAGSAFPTTGPRVPALVISPQVAAGQVFSAPLDHTCVLQMLAQRFDGAGASYSDMVKARVDQGLGALGDILTVAPAAAPRTPPVPVAVDQALARLQGVARANTAAAVAAAPPAHTEPDAMSQAMRSAVVSAEASRRARGAEAPPTWKALTAKSPAA
jgi:phospholipase C